MPKGGKKHPTHKGPKESQVMTRMRRQASFSGPKTGLRRFHGHLDALLDTIVSEGQNLSSRPGMKLRKLTQRHGLGARLPSDDHKTAKLAHRLNWAAGVRQLRQERRSTTVDPLVRQQTVRSHEARRRRLNRLHAGVDTQDPALDRIAPSAPWWPSQVRAEASYTLSDGSPDGRFARTAARGLVHAIYDNAAALGFRLDHASFDSDGIARSVYGRLDTGERVRISDYPVHDTPLRCTKRARFGEPRWDGELIIEGAVWRWSLADVLQAARVAAANKQARTHSTSARIQPAA